MKKLRLPLSENFTIHAAALINHIHAQPKKIAHETLESRLQLMQEYASFYAMNRKMTNASIQLDTAAK